MNRLSDYITLRLLLLLGFLVVGCGEKSSNSDKAASTGDETKNNALDSLVVSDLRPKVLGNIVPLPTNVPKLLSTFETCSESSVGFESRTITTRGEMQILIDSVQATQNSAAIRQQQIVYGGNVICFVQRGDAKPTLHTNDGSVQVAHLDCNGDRRSDFLFLLDSAGKTVEGFIIRKDGFYVPVPSKMLFDQNSQIRPHGEVVKRYESMLHNAVEERDLPGVKRLLELGMSPNARNAGGNTILHAAASRGFLNIVTLLVKAGATMNAANHDGQTPYDLAMRGKHSKVSDYLGAANLTAVYLAEMKPQGASVGWGSFVRYHSKSSGVSIAGRHYKTGFLAHANSSIKYFLGGKYDRFTSSIGLATGAGGGALFQVWVDGKRKFSSRDMWSRGNSVAYGHVGLSVDVRGGQLLELKTFGVRGCNGSHSCWGDPKLYFSKRPFLSNRTAFPKMDGNPTALFLLATTKVLTVGENDSCIWDLSTATPTPVKKYGVGAKQKNLVAWLGKSRTLAVAKGNKVELNQIQPNDYLSTEEWTLPANIWFVFSPRWREFLVVGTADRKLYMWTPADRKVIWKRSGLPSKPMSVAYCPLKDELAIGLSGGKCVILQAKTGELLHELSGHSFSVTHLSFSPSGEQLISSANDLTSIVWNTQDYSRKGQFIGHTGLVRGLDFIAEHMAISVDSDSEIIVWNTRTMGIVRKLHNLETTVDFAVDLQPRRLYLCSKDGVFSYEYDIFAANPK